MKQIAIVGPGFRAADYTKVVRELGCRVTYVAADEHLRQVASGCARADAVLYLVRCTDHRCEAHVQAACRRRNIPLRKVQTKGLESLQREAAALLAELAA